jgi:hypothetical protein
VFFVENEHSEKNTKIIQEITQNYRACMHEERAIMIKQKELGSLTMDFCPIFWQKII